MPSVAHTHIHTHKECILGRIWFYCGLESSLMLLLLLIIAMKFLCHRTFFFPRTTYIIIISCVSFEVYQVSFSVIIISVARIHSYIFHNQVTQVSEEGCNNSYRIFSSLYYRCIENVFVLENEKRKICQCKTLTCTFIEARQTFHFSRWFPI